MLGGEEFKKQGPSIFLLSSSTFLRWTPIERAPRLCLALAEKADEQWFTLDDSTAQLPDLPSESDQVNITMSFYTSHSTYA